MRQILAAALLLTILGSASAVAQVQTRIIDTGPGLATITRFPDGSIMIYDTGHWSHDARVFSEFQEFIGDSDVDLLIASHSDSDHISATDEVFNEFRVHRVIRTGLERDTQTWKDHRDAIVRAANQGLTHDINLAQVTLPHGTSYTFGGATVTYLSGFHEPPAAWRLTGSEFRNGNSIVVRVEFAGKSILFTGDAVGREEGSPQNAAAVATERFLIDNSGSRPITSDVLIVPHHGSDDASSTEFIRSVGARWVVFSAGHEHEHPKRVTAERYLDLGYEPRCLLRTDLGDNEGEDEWAFGTTQTPDRVGDDSVEIIIPSDGELIVRYAGQDPIVCPNLAMAAAPVISSIVKKSRSGICHTPASRWYERTNHFEPYDNLDSCLASGGRAL